MTTYKEVGRLCGEIGTLRYSQTIFTENKKALQYLGEQGKGKEHFYIT